MCRLLLVNWALTDSNFTNAYFNYIKFVLQGTYGIGDSNSRNHSSKQKQSPIDIPRVPCGVPLEVLGGFVFGTFLRNYLGNFMKEWSYFIKPTDFRYCTLVWCLDLRGFPGWWSCHD